MKCCICGLEINGYGNNPEGAAYVNEQGEVVFMTFEEGNKCCKACNDKYVIPGRMYKLGLNK